MAKRTVKSHKKLFSFDFESLLLSDNSEEDPCESGTLTSKSSKYPKKLKPDDSKPIPTKKIQKNASKMNDNQKGLDNDEFEEFNDVTIFCENVGNDINKSAQLKKARLGQFTETVISIYQTKMTEMVKKQEAEAEEFRKHTMNILQEELSKCHEEYKRLRVQENELAKILKQQQKMVQMAATNHEQLIENFTRQHKNFFQAYEELKKKHKNEIFDLKKYIGVDVSKLQNKFLLESKKEEMQTMKKYLSSVYF